MFGECASNSHPLQSLEADFQGVHVMSRQKQTIIRACHKPYSAEQRCVTLLQCTCGCVTVELLLQVSSSCWDLLTRMLQPVPVQRASMAEVLAHPWVTEGMPQELATLNDRLLNVRSRRACMTGIHARAATCILMVLCRASWPSSATASHLTLLTVMLCVDSTGTRGTSG